MANELFGLFGSHLFDDRVMRERLPLSVYESLREIRDEGKPWNPEVADGIAVAIDSMKERPWSRVRRITSTGSAP